MENTGSNVYPEKQSLMENVGQGIPVEQTNIQNPQLIVVQAAGQALRKCDWDGCYFATFSRCDYRWCCRSGCGKSFCLDHKGHMIRIGKNQDYSTAVCVECAPGFWNAVVRLKVGTLLIVFLLLIIEMIVLVGIQAKSDHDE